MAFFFQFREWHLLYESVAFVFHKLEVSVCAHFRQWWMLPMKP